MTTANPAPETTAPADRAMLESAIEKLTRRARDLRAFNVSVIQDRWDQRLEALQKKVNATLADALGAGTAEYKQHAVGPLGDMDPSLGDRYSMKEFHDSVRQALGRAGTKVNAASELVARRLQAWAPDSPALPAYNASAPMPVVSAAGAQPAELAPAPAGGAVEAVPAPAAPTPVAATPMSACAPSSTPAPAGPASATATAPGSAGHGARNVAIICAAADAAGSAVSGLVAQLGWTPALRPPVAGTGAFLLEGLESLRGAEFAVVIPSADADAALLLQIGFLLGAVGRKRVCVLLSGEPQAVPVLDGLACHALDAGGLWRLLLARAMKQAGLEVDLNRAI